MWTAIPPFSIARNYLPGIFLPLILKKGQKIRFIGDNEFFPLRIPNNDTVFLVGRNTESTCVGYAHGYYNKLGLFKRTSNPFHEIHYLFRGVMTKTNNDPFHANTRPTMEFDVYIPESFLRKEVFKNKNWQISYSN